VEYPLCKSSTIGASYLISTHPNEPVRAIPRTEQYLDLFYIREAQGIGRFEVGLRENPVSGNTTTDFTLLVAFTRNWGQVF
jgi:hypothetical protein